MAWPFLNGMIKVVVTWGFEGKPSVNVHFVYQDAPASPITDAALLSAANAFYNGIYDEWRTRAATAWTCENIQAYDYSREGGNVIDTDESMGFGGALATQASPSQVCAVVSQRTARTGRSYRGRNYIVGLNESTVTDNELNNDLITDLGAMYAQIRSDLSVVDLSHVVYSLWNGGVKRTTPEPTDIIGTIVDGRPDTQRRRLPKMT
ncbi:unnamed protein product [marine sediment metagenome]|uniref:Uncharacterized protein n=1 Tax=marine sediment metagenome TaxID=412755 RepID=X1FBX3_9ZZZZ